MTYFCDKQRHLVCVPYSIENLHKMAEDLGIPKHFYHVSNIYKHAHYDIPARRIKEITEKCNLITQREILQIIKNAKNN